MPDTPPRRLVTCCDGATPEPERTEDGWWRIVCPRCRRVGPSARTTRHARALWSPVARQARRHAYEVSNRRTA